MESDMAMSRPARRRARSRGLEPPAAPPPKMDEKMSSTPMPPKMSEKSTYPEPPGMPSTVPYRSYMARFLVVGEDGVGLVQLGELLVGVWSVVMVGMELDRLLSKSALDLIGRCVALDAQHLVVIPLVRHLVDPPPTECLCLGRGVPPLSAVDASTALVRRRRVRSALPRPGMHLDRRCSFYQSRARSHARRRAPHAFAAWSRCRVAAQGHPHSAAGAQGRRRARLPSRGQPSRDPAATCT